MNISLRSRITQKILNFLFIHKNDSFYISELSKLINEDRANTYRQLLKLTEEGIINSGYQGQQRYFSINNSYRFLNEYKKIINQTFGLDSILKDKLSSISGIEKAFIFGSYAKNKLNSDSDLDLLVVGNYDIKKLAKILAELQKEWRLEINPIEYSMKEYNNKIKSKDNFLTSILKNPIIEII